MLPHLRPFVRFSDHEASDTDAVRSAILRRREGEVERERNSNGAPGSRRYRRFLNSVVSDYETEGERTEVESQDEEIVRFEWKGLFLDAGEAFFNDPDTVTLAPRRRNRRRRKKHEADKEPGATAFEEGDKGDSGSDTYASGVKSPAALYRKLDKATRMAFRRVLKHEDEAGGFLEILESLLIAFKNGDPLHEDEEKCEEFDIVGIEDHKLVLHVHNSYERLLLHGFCVFHQIKSTSINDAITGNRHTIVTKPVHFSRQRHDFSLIGHMRSLQRAPTMLPGLGNSLKDDGDEFTLRKKRRARRCRRLNRPAPASVVNKAAVVSRPDYNEDRPSSEDSYVLL